MVLCGWGRAKFREGTIETPLKPDSEIIFSVGADTMGLLDNQLGNMSDFLTSAKVSKPNNASICYHRCTQQPDNTWTLQKETNKKAVLLLVADSDL